MDRSTATPHRGRGEVSIDQGSDGDDNGLYSGTGSTPAFSSSINPASTSNKRVFGHEQVVSDDDEEHDAKRSKKSTSAVWQYYTKEKKTVMVNGKKYTEKWASCNFPKCKARYRCESNKGTTRFWTHLRTVHRVVKGQQQLVAGKDYEKDINGAELYRYDEKVSMRKFYLAIIMHDYPFNIVEHEYLVDFFKSLRPSFPIKSHITIKKDIMDLYFEEKNKLYAHLRTLKCQFSTTMNMLTNRGYMCVMVHWIDADWRIQKRVIDLFHVEGQHTEQKLYISFNECMVRWCIEKKLFSLTLDNASANELAVKDVINDLKTNVDVSLVCDGAFFHVRCIDQILNLVAKEGLNILSQTIEDIKSLVLAVKESPQQWEKLMKHATECGLQTNKCISLDVSTKWNSTFLLLKDVLYYKDAFMRLKIADQRRYEHIFPSPVEWNKVKTLCHGLKKFYDLNELLYGTLYPTANLFYKGFCEIRILLAEWSTHEDTTICEMAIAMSKKFEKYWQKLNFTLAVASFLDPRYKKKIIEFYMKKLYGDVLYHAKVEEFISVLRQMYQFYVALAPSKKTPKPEPIKTKSYDLYADVDALDEDLEQFLYGSYSSDVESSNDLEKYMAEPLLKYSEQFDILSWWRNQENEYPILSQMVRDVLAIQMSTIALEPVFSVSAHVVNPYGSQHDPEMVKALFCIKNWVAAAKKDYKSVASIVDDLEVIKPMVNMAVQDADIESDPDVVNENENLGGKC